MTRLQTALWREEAEPADAFATQRAECRGYDVYGELVGRAQWSEMVLLLLTGERPTGAAATLLSDLSVALANPGPREPSVHAAMAAGVSGAPAAAVLMAALSAGAGQGGGSHDVRLAMEAQLAHGADLASWPAAGDDAPPEKDDVWPAMEHLPGFEPHSPVRATTVDQTLHALAAQAPEGRLAWLRDHGAPLEAKVGRPLSMAGVAAAALLDLGLTPTQGEMLHLLLRLPGAAAHALEQAELGFKSFPFPAIELLDDPAQAGEPAALEAS